MPKSGKTEIMLPNYQGKIVEIVPSNELEREIVIDTVRVID